MIKDILRPNMTVYGPYLRKDGRKHVVLYDGKVRQTMSYPKWLTEQRIERILDIDETIDHLDKNFTNNEQSNLVIRSKSEHASIDTKHAELVFLICIECKIALPPRRASDIRGNAKKGKAGPFCKHCAGVYGTKIQNIGEDQKLPAQPTAEYKYYYMKK